MSSLNAALNGALALAPPVGQPRLRIARPVCPCRHDRFCVDALRSGGWCSVRPAGPAGHLALRRLPPHRLRCLRVRHERDGAAGALWRYRSLTAARHAPRCGHDRGRRTDGRLVLRGRPPRQQTSVERLPAARLRAGGQRDGTARSCHGSCRHQHTYRALLPLHGRRDAQRVPRRVDCGCARPSVGYTGRAANDAVAAMAAASLNAPRRGRVSRALAITTSHGSCLHATNIALSYS